ALVCNQGRKNRENSRNQAQSAKVGLKHPPKLIALLRDHQLHQPELVWWGELAPGNAKYDVAFEEHDQLLTLPLQDALITGEPAIPLTPVARSAIALLQAMRQANAQQ
ncbi:MAG: hypothetical protein ACP5O7_02585, partial [Phycisphaerae bacterium]